MANVANLEKKLLELINTDDSFAIALTGEWGAGKTYFWKYFKQKNLNQFKLQKYAYVSLFGIDSLDSLKYEIAVKTHAINQLEDRLQGAKSLFNKALDTVDFSKMGGNGLSLNIGKSFITSMLSSLVSKTVICIDDIERVSDNLPIKDVMGLINDLKLEKNCQVIVILHDAKANKQFQEYKEKVLDEVLVLDDNLAILQTFITDDIALDVMQLFYRTMNVKNLRFYNKVLNNYQQITTSITSLSKTSREYILKNLLIVRWIDEFQPEIILDNEQSSFKATLDLFLDKNKSFIKMSDDRFLMQTEEIKAFRNHLEPFYPLFSFDDWAMHIISMLHNHDISEESIKYLIEKDILSEVNLQDDLFHQQVINEFHSLKLQPNFCERLYYSACAKIQRSELNNISFYCNIFENCGRKGLAQQLENHVKQFIEREINTSQSRPTIGDWYRFKIEPYERFREFIVESIENYRPINVNSHIISSVFLRYYKDRISNGDDEDILTSIDKSTLREVIWTEIEDERYRRQFIHSILLHPVLNEVEGKKEEVRMWILELLNEKIEESSGSEVPIRMWLKSTNDLTENLS